MNIFLFLITNCLGAVVILSTVVLGRVISSVLGNLSSSIGCLGSFLSNTITSIFGLGISPVLANLFSSIGSSGFSIDLESTSVIVGSSGFSSSGFSGYFLSNTITSIFGLVISSVLGNLSSSTGFSGSFL